MKNIDILLVNSFAPRQRVMSDVALDNGLVALHTHLTEKGFGIEVHDELRIGSLERGVPRWCVKLLRLLTLMQLKAHRKGARFITLLLFALSKYVQAFSLFCRMRHMDGEIRRIVRFVKEHEIPTVGIKLWYGEAYKWSGGLAAKLREDCPETTVVVGGPQVKVYGGEVLHGQAFDLAIMGPGEEALAQLLTLRRQFKAKEAFLRRVSVVFSGAPLLITGGYRLKCDAAKAKETFTIPRYRDIDLKDKLLLHTLVDGSGCVWNKCSFCSHTRHKQSYQPRPVAEIIAEMKTLTQAGVGFFRFCSSETPLAHGRQIAKAILEEGLTVNYSMFKRAGEVTSATFDDYCLLIKSGLRAVFMGGETGHDLINARIMNKGTCQKEIIDTISCIRLAASAVGESCRVGLSLIYPCPVVEGVTLEDVYRENVALVSKALPDTVIVNPPGLFPGTKWYEQAEQLGFKTGKDLVSTAMQYEYSIYKPVETWDKIDCSLNGLSFLDLLKETGRLRKTVMELGIPTDISDEFLMMMEAIGCKTSYDLIRFKQQSLLDIMTGSASYGREIIRRINEESRRLAMLNRKG